MERGHSSKRSATRVVPGRLFQWCFGRTAVQGLRSRQGGVPTSERRPAAAEGDPARIKESAYLGPLLSAAEQNQERLLPPLLSNGSLQQPCWATRAPALREAGACCKLWLVPVCAQVTAPFPASPALELLGRPLFLPPLGKTDGVPPALPASKFQAARVVPEALSASLLPPSLPDLYPELERRPHPP